ncbi:hypothetical protein C1I95_01450 [Micromonospora craterilacus]|uniref:HTH tetR-type domain-containing protein n=1 Tax=Micromonospora craterilacus TaxID=1655439 RepID=A0A2W2FHB3_9ACTN|nr:TetR/AcrR family transcriptional regulator [Micromonospora craterilacus]PZG24038.1 hypothetical protein C1I95_01450 [Micromonospora craterilacus]
MESPRTYVQTARATATAGTRRRILDETVALVLRQASVDIVLADIAGAAGVSVQTVLRHFGSREGLFEAAVAHARQQVAAERAAPAGDVNAAVSALFDHYDRWGETMLRLLAQEGGSAKTDAVTEHGRQFHDNWVREVFAPDLAIRPADQHEAIIDLLMIATDLYTWKLLTRDRRLPRQQAEQRMLRLIASILGEGR